MEMEQNFLGLCAAGMYDGCLFHRYVSPLLYSNPNLSWALRWGWIEWLGHRNLKGFMIQTGDPTGTGKGGQSIYGKAFADEVRGTLKVSFYVPISLSISRSLSIILVGSGEELDWGWYWLTSDTMWSFQFNARGIVAMANSGPDTNKYVFPFETRTERRTLIWVVLERIFYFRSQFFITYAKQPHLDTKYTIFGRSVFRSLVIVELIEGEDWYKMKLWTESLTDRIRL